MSKIGKRTGGREAAGTGRLRLPGMVREGLCESFFATLECELLDRTSFKTQVEVRMAVFWFIEGWYNLHHRHSALDYLSPIDYERAYGAQPNFPCNDGQPLRESAAPPPAAAGKIGEEQDAINASIAGESPHHLQSPTPSTETG